MPEHCRVKRADGIGMMVRWISMHRLFSWGENTIPGVVALASRALAVVDAEQAAPLQKPRVGFRDVEAMTKPLLR